MREKTPSFKIRKIENGFVVTDDTADGTGRYGNEFSFPDLAEALAFIKNNYVLQGIETELEAA